MENQFIEKMRSLSDKDLLGVLEKRNEYQSLAVEAAINEALKRAIVDEDLKPKEQILSKIKNEEIEIKENNYQIIDNKPKPLSFWLILILLILWTITKCTDVYYIVIGDPEINNPIILIGLIIIPINIYCIYNLWALNPKILKFTKSYAGWVFFFVVYSTFTNVKTNQDVVYLLIVALMCLPILLIWLIIKYSSLKDYFIEMNNLNKNQDEKSKLND